MKMSVDFNREVDRRSTSDVKWRPEGLKGYLPIEVSENEIPMWIADMEMCIRDRLNSMCAMGYIAGPLMFGRYLRRSECTTMPEYFGARYCNLKNRRVAGIITAVSRCV